MAFEPGDDAVVPAACALGAPRPALRGRVGGARRSQHPGPGLRPRAAPWWQPQHQGPEHTRIRSRWTQLTQVTLIVSTGLVTYS